MIKVLTFKIDDGEFAFNIDSVERIISFEKPREIPQSDLSVEGVIDYEGKVLPIINLKYKLKMEDADCKSSCEYSNDNKIIIIRNEDEQIGVIVDSVTEIIDVTDENIQDVPDIISDNDVVSEILKIDTRIIALLDCNILLSPKNDQQEI